MLTNSFKSMHLLIRKIANTGSQIAVFAAVGMTCGLAQGQTQGEKIAIIGDSISTGAATHPNMSFNALTMWDIFLGKTDVSAVADPKLDELLEVESPASGTYPAPTKIWPSSREFLSGLDWVGAHMMNGIGQTYLNTEEYSWGYGLGRKLNIAPENILFAAQNGQKMANLIEQIDRVLKPGKGTLPDRLFIFFTGNDLCAQAYPLMTKGQLFEEQLWKGIQYLLRNSVPDQKGTTVYIPAFLDVAQIVYSEEILDKPVDAHGKQTTCRQLRKDSFFTNVEEVEKNAGDNPLPGMFIAMVPPNPNSMCPTLFSPQSTNEESIKSIANKVRAYRTAQQSIVDRANTLAKEKYPDMKISFSYIAGTGDITFGATDIGPDCFHLTKTGQAKITQKIFKAL